MAPEHRVRSHRIQLLGEIFLHDSGEAPARAAGQLFQIFREGAHVLVILLRVELKRFLRKRPFDPSSIEGMFQQMVLLDE
jgi:hypothetical protein